MARKATTAAGKKLQSSTAKRRKERLAKAKPKPAQKKVVPGKDTAFLAGGKVPGTGQTITRRGRTQPAPLPGQATPLPDTKSALERERKRAAFVEKHSGPRVFRTPEEVDIEFQTAEGRRGGFEREFQSRKKALEDQMTLGQIDEDEFNREILLAERERDTAIGGTDLLTREQRDAAIAQLERGAPGVDPFGFGGPQARRDAEGNLLGPQGRRIIPEEGQDLVPFGLRPSEIAGRRPDPAEAFPGSGRAGTSELASPFAGAMGRPGARGFSGQQTAFTLSDVQDKARRGELLSEQEIAIEIKGAIESASSAGINAPQDRAAIIQGIRDRELNKAQRQQVQQEEAQRRSEMATTQSGLTASATEESRQDALNQTGITISQAENNNVLSQILGSIPEDMPGREAVISAFEEAARVRNEALGMAGIFGQQQLSNVDQAFNRIDNLIDEGEIRTQERFVKAEKIFSGVLDRQNKLLAQREENAQNQLQFQEDKLVREQRDVLQSELDTMTASLALRGGFGSESGLAQIREAKRAGEQAIIDLQKEFGFKRADVSIAYTSAYNQALDNYQIKTFEAWDKMETSLNNLRLQRISSEAARTNAENGIIGQMMKDMVQNRNDYANNIISASNVVVQAISSQKQENRLREQDALAQIEYLSQNFMPSDVEDAIRELSKDVTSFDASVFAGAMPIDVQKKLADIRKKSIGTGAFIPTPDIPSPISFDEFADQKIAELEEQEFQSFDLARRDELKKENESLWRSEYERVIAPSFDSLPSSGNSAVDLLAKSVLDGTQPESGLRLAAKSEGVPLSAVLKQIETLRNSGYVPAFPTLTPEQSKNYFTLDKERRKNSLYKKAADAISGYSNIKGQQNLGTGASQIAIINTFQGQLVDPGATVRSEDVELMKTATAYLDKINPAFLLKKINEGQLVPQSLIDQIVESSERIVEMRVNNYNDIVLPSFTRQAKLVGLPETVFQPLGVNSVVMESTPGLTFDYDTFFKEQGYE